MGLPHRYCEIHKGEHMKKFTLLILLVALACTTVLGVCASAESVSGNIHFINPTAIAVLDNTLFVADVVEENKSVVLCFDIDTYAYKTLQIDGMVQNLSASQEKLFVVLANCVQEYTFGTSLSLVKTHDLEGIVDICYGMYEDKSVLYYAQNVDGSINWYRQNLQTGVESTIAEGKENTLDCIAFNENGNDFTYFTAQNSIKRFNGTKGEYSSKDALNGNLSLQTEFVPQALFTYTNASGNLQLAVYDKHNVFDITEKKEGENIVGYDAKTSVFYRTMESDIECIASCNNKIFVLNSFNQIEVYTLGANGYTNSNVTIGSETVEVNMALPTKFTGFTLAKSTGYPTNIVYKTTNEQTSVENIVTDYYQDVIVLNFEGAEQLPYYYVLVGDKFGWIKKSDDVQVVADDPNMHITDTKVSANGVYTAKFTSANSVYVYDLPFADANKQNFSQSFDKLTTVTLLQKFNDSQNVGWYYVSFILDGDTKMGFVREGNIGQFQNVATKPQSTIIGDKKINSTLFNAVSVCLAPDLKDVLCDSNGKQVKLFSGEDVKAIKLSDDGKAMFVQVIAPDGKTITGWVDATRLIEVDDITSNAIIGICFVSVAITLGVLVVVVLVQRKKATKKEVEETTVA